MATYLILNLIFLAAVLIVLAFVRGLSWNRSVVKTLIIVLIMTAIFDSLIIGAGIVAYDTSLISGLYIGLAPVEDFFYAILVCLLIPSTWQLLERKNHGKN